MLKPPNFELFAPYIRQVAAEMEAAGQVLDVQECDYQDIAKQYSSRRHRERCRCPERDCIRNFRHEALAAIAEMSGD
jgi:hypothetical protein